MTDSNDANKRSALKGFRDLTVDLPSLEVATGMQFLRSRGRTEINSPPKLSPLAVVERSHVVKALFACRQGGLSASDLINWASVVLMSDDSYSVEGEGREEVLEVLHNLVSEDEESLNVSAWIGRLEDSN